MSTERNEELNEQELDSVAGGATDLQEPHEEVPPHLQDQEEKEHKHPDRKAEEEPIHDAPTT